MYYGNIKKNDIANGLGVRVSLFVSGCTHACEGCFNAETWNFTYGQPFTEETEEEILEALSPDQIAGLTLLGGEPFEPENQRVLTPFLHRVRGRYPDKDVWCYTGYLLDRDLLEMGEPAKGTGVMAGESAGTGTVTHFSSRGEQPETLAEKRVTVPVPLTHSLQYHPEMTRHTPYDQKPSRVRARCEVTDEMLSLIDVLVDGEFVLALKDITLKFRGSSNQRIMDLRAMRS